MSSNAIDLRCDRRKNPSRENQNRTNPSFLDVALDSEEVVGHPEQIDELVDHIIANYRPEKRGFWQGEYEDNARTALFEGLTARGHLSHLEFTGDAETIHEGILQRLINGLNAPMLHPHELKRRRAELREEIIIWLVHQQILNGDLPPDVEILTDSTFPENMKDRQAERAGYRASNKKGMLRATHFEFLDNGQVRRVIEQLSYANSSAQQSLSARGLIGDDATLLGRPLIYRRNDLRDGVVDVMRSMDRIHADSFGWSEIRYGDSPDNLTIAYENLRTESARREQQIEHFVIELADFERAIDRGEQSRFDYNNKVAEIIKRICIQDPRFTLDALGEKVVESFEKAHDLAMSGDYSGAAAAVMETAHLQTAVVICGGESSGGENINLSSDQVSAMSKMSESEKTAFINKIKKDTEKSQNRGGGHVTCPFCKKRTFVKDLCDSRTYICEKCGSEPGHDRSGGKTGRETESEKAGENSGNQRRERLERAMALEVLKNVEKFEIKWHGIFFERVAIGRDGEILASGKEAENLQNLSQKAA